eukprot:TRINITY_DN113780_c0_g1_i1.p1 TRINITY_DN113780_c0_g1~~TRINITY_DN113780_c0_g1_i1.p1  ORF type:complete len:327 (+),score=41.03 TRINITY_DN113780_c0_g1_i1:272-1252(+)
METPHSTSNASLNSFVHNVEVPILGGDRRGNLCATTMMIKRLPASISQSQLLEELNISGFAGAYDFCYLPCDFGSGASRGFAFVNFKDSEVASRFFDAWNGRAHFTDKHILCVSAADVQGLQANLKRWAGRSDRIRNPSLKPFILGCTHEDQSSILKPRPLLPAVAVPSVHDVFANLPPRPSDVRDAVSPCCNYSSASSTQAMCDQLADIPVDSRHERLVIVKAKLAESHAKAETAMRLAADLKHTLMIERGEQQPDHDMKGDVRKFLCVSKDFVAPSAGYLAAKAGTELVALHREGDWYFGYELLKPTSCGWFPSANTQIATFKS